MTLHLRLDHAGVIVSDLEHARRCYERLGFALTPRSDLMAATEPGGPLRQSGSNHCAMLQNGYIEILGTTESGAGTGIADRLARYEGLHIIALRGDDADKSYQALISRTTFVNPPVTFTRDIDVEGSTKTLEFRTIVAQNDAFPEAAALIVEHKTPELLWRPNTLSHPNGAVSLAEVFICPRIVERTAEYLAQLLDVTPKWPKDDVAVIDLHRGSIRVMSEAALAHNYGGLRPPRLPCPVGIAVTVSDLHQTRTVLSGNEVPFMKGDGQSIWVSPEHAHGVVVVFSQV